MIYPYLYKSSGWRDQLVSYNGETFEYDEIGNPTTCRGETFVWNGRQLVQLGDCKYTYNASGIRTSKIVNGIKTKFFSNGNKILAQDDGNKVYYHYGADGIVGFTLKLSETIIYEYTYKKNIQGDIIGIYDSNNVLICKYIYDAWGNHKTLILSNNGEYVDISSTSDYTNINNNYIFIATLNPFRYRGYYFDTDTGLYYLNSRYYDPELGRFINADSLDNIDTENLNGFNLYMYCADNPVMLIDENGDAWWNPATWNWKKIGAIVGAVVVVSLTTALVVATAGVALAAVGASAAVTNAVLVGATIGGLVSGFGEIISQSITNGIDNLDYTSIFIQTFTGSSSGAFTGATMTSISNSVRVASRIGIILTSGLSSILNGINEGKTAENIILSTMFSIAISSVFQIKGFKGDALLKNAGMQEIFKSLNKTLGLNGVLKIAFSRLTGSIWNLIKQSL